MASVVSIEPMSMPKEEAKDPMVPLRPEPVEISGARLRLEVQFPPCPYLFCDDSKVYHFQFFLLFHIYYYFNRLAMVAIIVAIDAVPEAKATASEVVILVIALVGTTISQPGITFVPRPALATSPFI